MSDEEDDWKYIYDQSNAVEESPRKRRRGLRNTSSLTPIGVKRLSDNEEFYIGDCVLLESGSDIPYVGIIESFFFSEKGFMETKTIWFRRLSEIARAAARRMAPEVVENELFITSDTGRDSIDIILEHAKVFDFKEYEGVSEEDKKNGNIFVCRRAYNSDKSLFSEDYINWSNIYKGRSSDMIELMNNILEVRPLAKNKKRAIVSPQKVSPIRKQQRKKVVDSTSEEEDDDDDEDEDKVNEKGLGSSDEDEFFDAKPEFEPESPLKSKRTRKSSQPKTPTKRKRSENTPVKSSYTSIDPPAQIKKILRHQALSELRQNVRVTPDTLQKLPTRTSPLKEPSSPHKFARDKLHVSTVPDSLPCRETEFSQIFLSLESAIMSQAGTCIYVSGTPGTGKTATIREVISQLQFRVEDNELPEFSFVEINGMKLTNPHTAYEILWEAASGKKAAAATSMISLEKHFKLPPDDTKPLVVLMDELDQLVTKNQGVMYNFFNWPTLTNSKLIVIAVANTMDLPERMLSNKISSRLGLTRIQFPGYNHEQLREIISSRLSNLPQESSAIVEKDAIEFAARKIAGVSGDARRALDICRRAVELAQPEIEEEDIDGNNITKHRVTIDHIKKAISESTSSPVHIFLRGLSMSSKIFVCAVLSRVRRSGVIDNPLGDILQETDRLIKLSEDSAKLSRILLNNNQVRMAGFQHALTELLEGGILIQQMLRGERSANVRLAIGEEYIKSAFKNDPQVAGMI